ncbi:MAG: hypothetical protein J1F11_09940 [Oscillospiraceae bacterium]|nr:hypothetical protein [Oscillospiraceae bacterium]
MKLFLFFLVVLCVVFILFSFVILLYWKKRNAKKGIPSIEENVKKFTNSIGFISLQIGAVSLLVASITTLLSFKEPKIDIKFTAASWYESGVEFIDIPDRAIQRNPDNILYQRIAEPFPDPLRLAIVNEGNSIATNIIIKIRFLTSESIEHLFISPYYVSTGAVEAERPEITLVPKEDIILVPNSYYILPRLPFYMLSNTAKLDNIKIQVTVMYNSNINITKNFTIPIEDTNMPTDFLSDDDGGDYYYNRLATDLLYLNDFDSLSDYSLEDIKYAYKYCLQKITVSQNPTIKVSALHIGRLYYTKLFSQMQQSDLEIIRPSDIEMLVFNDIYFYCC